MVSKSVKIALAVIITGVMVFLILWFLNNRKTQTTQTKQRSTSPLTTVEHNVSSFVNHVRRGFTDVLRAGENYVGKYLGWSEKELSNIAGIIETGASDVEKGAYTFAKDLYHVISVGGADIARGAGEVGKYVLQPTEAIPKEIYGGVEQVGKYLPQIPSDIEKGFQGFINDVKSILKRL